MRLVSAFPASNSVSSTASHCNLTLVLIFARLSLGYTTRVRICTACYIAIEPDKALKELRVENPSTNTAGDVKANEPKKAARKVAVRAGTYKGESVCGLRRLLGVI